MTMNPALKWPLLILAGLLGLLILIVGGALAWLATGSGRDFALSQAQSFVPGLEIDGAEGNVYDLRLGRLTMADEKGIWLTVEGLRLDWAPTSLLSRTFRVELAGAGRVALERLPETQDEPQEETGPFELPVDVVVDRLDLDRVELGEALLNGQTAVLTAEGSARLPRGELGGSAELAVNRIDDQPGSMVLDATYVPDQRLTVDLKAQEPEGGVIAGLLDIPGRPPVEITLTGDGPLTDWTGNLSARAGDVASAAAEARIRPAGNVFAFGLDLTADIAALLPAEYAELVGPDLNLGAGGFVIPGERLSLDGISLRAAAGSIAGQGVYRLDEQTLNFGYYGAVTGDGPIRRLLPPEAAFQTVQVSGKAVGPVDAPAVTATASVIEPSFTGWAADRLTLTAVTDPALGTPEDGYGRFGLNASAVVEGPTAPDPALTQLLGPRAQLDIVGEVATEGGVVEISRLALDSSVLDMNGQGRAAGWGETLQARLNLEAGNLAAFSPIAGQDLSGALGLDLDVARGDDGVLNAELNGRARDLSTGIPAADALLSPETELAATAAVGEAVRVPSFRIAGERATITGQATLSPDQRLTAELAAEVPDLTALGQALGSPMLGAVTLQARAEGPLDGFSVNGTLRARDLLLQGNRYPEAVAEVAAEGLPAAPRGRLALTSTVNEQPLELTTRFDMQEQTLRLPELALQAGANAVRGELTADLAAGTATGDLNADLPELATLGALAGERLTGSGNAEISLTAPDGRQRAQVTAELTDLARLLPDGVQRAQRLTLNGSYAAQPDGAAVEAELNGQGIEAAGARIDRVAATADGPLQEMQVALDLIGQAGGPMELNTAGTVMLEEQRTRLRLASLTGSYDGENFRIARPAELTVAGEGFAVQELEITSGQASIAVDADLTGQKLAADLRIRQVPLALARLVDPTLELGGELNGQASLSGTVAEPVGGFGLSIQDFRTAPDRIQTASLDADVKGEWRGGRLDVTLTTQGGENVDLTGRGGLPLILAGGPLAFEIPQDRPVRAELDGQLDLSLLNDVLAATGDRVAGLMRVDLNLEGTMADTRLAGTVGVENGRYENQEYGTTIQDITALLDGDPDGLTIRTFQGRTPNGGTLTADGAIRFDPAFGDRQIDVTVTADRARVAQTDRITADADAKLSLTGSFDEALLAGNIGIRQAYVTLPDTLPPDVVDLDVVEVNDPQATAAPPPIPGRRPTRQADGAPSQTGPAEDGAAPQTVSLSGGEETLDIFLKIDVDAPNEIYVQGRGLDAEFKADLDITGTASAPEVVGAVTLVKGELSILGQTLNLTRGVITFPGGSALVPQLDIEAQTTRDDLTAIIAVTGTPEKPQVTLTSDPPVPEDEVLSQLLFNRGIGQLSALEALQLAQGAAQLTGVLGSGPGVLDTVRRGLGVDRLEFRGSETGEGLGTVAAGRYIGDKIYLGVEQDLSTGQSEATVEYDINQNIQLRGEVGRTSQVGVQFEWDY